MDNKNHISYFCILIVSLFMIESAYAQKRAVEWFNKGTKASNLDEKVQFYKKSIELDPNFVEAHYNLAYVYKNKNDHENALKSFNEALNLIREEKDKRLRVSIYYELGICYKRIDNYPKSIEMLENAKMLVKDKKIRVHILYELGRIAFLVELPAGAVGIPARQRTDIQRINGKRLYYLWTTVKRCLH